LVFAVAWEAPPHADSKTTNPTGNQVILRVHRAGCP
jgi:hypothetical protein